MRSGGPWPHPSRPGGHSFGHESPPPPPIVDDAWRDSPTYLRAVALFNAGYYWEAHESWESLWLAHARTGPTADALKALIKLAAAGVKLREGRPAGASAHFSRAAELFQLAAVGGPHQLGLDLPALAEAARTLAAAPPVIDASPGAPIGCVIPISIEPT